VAGTPYRLEYWSDRAKKNAHSLKITVSGPGPMPKYLREIRATIEVAGQRWTKGFSPSPNQSFVFEWDGKDAFGRILQGPQPVRLEVDNVYDLEYGTTPEFGDLSDSTIDVNPNRGEFLVKRFWTTKLGNLAADDQGLGGWDFDVHHVYNPNLRTLYFGSGYRQESAEMPLIVRGFAGTGEAPVGGTDADGIPATQAKLISPSGLAVAPDGSVYIANEDSGTIRRVTRDGTITTVVAQPLPNLIQNPGCEVCANPTCTGPVEPYWSGDIYDWECFYENGGGPAFDGHYYFNNHHGSPAGREVYQDIDVSAYSAAIQAGNQRFTLGAAAQGYGIVYQSLRLVAEFRDETNKNVLDAIDIQHHPTTDWGTFAQSRVAPAGTRWIRVKLVTEDSAASFGGVNVDALSLRALGPDGQGEGLLRNPRGLAVGPDGSLYIAAESRVWKRSPSGSLTPIAGTGEWGYGGDGGPATFARLRKPMGVALGADGSLYIADVSDHRVRRVAPNGNISTILGDGSLGFATELELAKGQPVIHPTGVAVDPQGAIYVSGHDRIVRIGPDGILTIYAGGADAMEPPVDSAPLAILTAVTYPTGLAFAPDGTLYGADRNRIFKIDTDGRFIQLAWDTFGDLRDGVVASRAAVAPESLALLPTGELLFADREMNRVRSMSPALPGLGASDILIASRDGKEAYVFDHTGRHLRTVDAMTGVTTLQFGYDAQGRVAALMDRDGNQTRVERDASGAPAAIVAPFGQRTTLSLGGDGMLKSIADPMGGQVSMTYSNGLMSTFTDARGGVHRFTFDDAGLLIKDENPAVGSKSLIRTMTETGFNVDVTTALGRTTSHKVGFSYTGSTTWTNTAPDRTATSSTYGRSTWQASYPDSTTWNANEEPDPRFGLQAPVLGQSTYTTPGGLTADVKTEKSVVLSDATDPLSLKKLTEKSTVNSKVTTSTYDAVARTMSSER
jgi:YD repeat-containing protein